MNLFLKANRVIGDLVSKGQRKFILYPYGEQGMMIKQLLQEKYGIEVICIVDNYLAQISNNPKICAMSEIGQYLEKDVLVLLTSDNEDIYSQIRYQLMQNVPFNQIVDVFSLSIYFDSKMYYEQVEYINRPRLAALETTAREIYQNDVHGAVVECGVYKGWFANYISRVFPDRKLYLFDTFEGFSNRDIDEQEENFSSEFRSKTNLDDTSVELALNQIAYRTNAIVRKGYFPDTAQGLEEERFAFVSLDTDLYKPILAGLEFFWPRMNSGGVIFVDDLGHKELLGVRKAILEFCRKEKIGYVSIPDGTDLTAVIVKPL